MKHKTQLFLILLSVLFWTTTCVDMPYRARVYSSAPSPKMNELKTKKWAILPTLTVYPVAAISSQIDGRFDSMKVTNPNFIQATPSDIKKSLTDVSFTKSLSKIYTSVWEREKTERIVLASGKELLQAQFVKAMNDGALANAATVPQPIETDDDFFVSDLKGLEGDFKSLKLKQDYAILPVLLDYRPHVTVTDIYIVVFPVFLGKKVLESYNMTYFVVDLKTGKNIRTIRSVLGNGGVEDSNIQIDSMISQVLEN
ncbi:hypothetical protein [Leptospira stimsonii]|uniref:Lipoprotein n=1 Tax=Leptospira stimsonii TaxID=2202203 RepID=A0A396Z2V9_9LEPT|nr:hypothetical protein [Leptospira stimsonii]RHX89819.1 hypothetical protein DLM75_12745 [Leptospira stimsonii]